MVWSRGRRWLAGLALLSLPACTGLSADRPGPRLEPPVPTGAAYRPVTPAAVVARTPAAPKSPPSSLPAEVVQARAVTPARVEAIAIEPADGPELQLAPDESPLAEALRCYQAKAAGDAARRLEQFDPPTRELLGRLLPLAACVGEGGLSRADPQDVAALVEQLDGLLEPLRARAALEIPKLCFCRPVAAPARFGAYDLLEENHLFRPGETVAVYLELRNFASEPHGGGSRTHVRTTVEVHDGQGRVVFRFDADRADPTLSPRRDYCHVGRFAVPQLPAGAYTLWLKATDVPTGRTAKRSLDFRVTTLGE